MVIFHLLLSLCIIYVLLYELVKSDEIIFTLINFLISLTFYGFYGH